MLLFFGASVLPDPDFPYEPTATQCHTWATALIFETVFAGWGFFKMSASGSACIIDHTLLALHFCRIVCFATAIMLYSAQQKKPGSSEASPLLDAEDDATYYGATNAQKKLDRPARDAQTTGWLDYLIGFGTFWPYIW